MKNIKYFIVLILTMSITSEMSIANQPVELPIVYNSSLENGWYEATVEYSNLGTYYKETYTLNVKVEYDEVVKISFGNGGSVHSGYNNDGYIYTGGRLSFQSNMYGEIYAATTRVTVLDNGDYKYYDITIE